MKEGWPVVARVLCHASSSGFKQYKFYLVIISVIGTIAFLYPKCPQTKLV